VVSGILEPVGEIDQPVERGRSFCQEVGSV
jgi:hypothetical protein